MYFIVSHDRRSGIGADDSLYGKGQSDYLELGWELAATRIYFNLLLNSGRFNQDEDYLVAATDRMFLYTKYVKNVIPFKIFEKKSQENNFIVHDLTANGVSEALRETMPTGRYVDAVKNLKENTEIDLLDSKKILRNDKKFICLAVRKRGHELKRSLPQDLIDYIIEYANKNNIDVYVFGKGCEDYDNGNNVHHVSFQECATVLNHDNCVLFITSISGGGMIRFFTGKCKHLVFDCSNEYDKNNLFNYGDDIDFSGVIKNNLLDVENDILKFLEKFQNIIRSNS